MSFSKFCSVLMLCVPNENANGFICVFRFDVVIYEY